MNGAMNNNDVFEPTGGTGRTHGTDINQAASIGSAAECAGGTDGTVLSDKLALIPVASYPEPKRPGFQVYDHPARCLSKTYLPGVWWHESRDSDQSAAPHDRWVCSPLHIEAITSCNGGEFGRLLRFRNSLGRWREWAMPMRLLKGSGEELRGELLNLGLEIDLNSFRLLNQYIQSQRPRREVISAASTGWQSPELFVMPSQNIGKGDAIYQSETANLEEFRHSGTLEGWQAEIGARCAGNPILMLGVCAGLAGPLLYHVNRQSGGFHIVGDSSTGKSSAIQAAASAWGNGEQFKRSWRATGNGLEGIAEQRNDTLLALDEIGEADPAEIGAVVYAIANGVGRQRAGRSGAALATRRWRVVVFSSGELGLSAHMAEGGKVSRAGQEIRLLDIPAQRTFGAWDDLCGFAGGRELSDALQKASVTHYGHAGPLFIRRLLESGEVDGLSAMSAALVAQFPHNSGQEGRAAERFALLGLAGELAIKWNILPVPRGTAQAAMLELFEAWRIGRGHGQSEDVTILRSLSDFLSRHGDALFSALGADVVVKDRVGWWRDDGDTRTWLFTAEGLRRAVPGYEMKRILTALETAGWIAKRSNKERAKKVKVRGRSIWLYHLIPKEEQQSRNSSS